MNSPHSAHVAGFRFALTTVAIDAVGIGIIFPVMPDLLLSLGIESVSDAALWGGLLSTLYALAQFLCAPLLGNLSDRFGRRPVMLVALAAMTVDYAILSVAGGLTVLLIGRALAGAAGATYATASAYVADITSAQERASRFGKIGAVFGLGFVLGPALGGIVGEWHVRAPFMLAALMAGANFIFGFIALPESLPVDRRRPFSLARANPFSALKRAFALPGLRGLLVAYLLFNLGNHVYPSVWAYWSKTAFGWSVGTIGLSLAAYGIAMASVQGGLVQPAIAWMGERRTVLVGLALGVVAAVGYGVIDAGWMAFALIPIVASSDLAAPALTSLMANRVGDDEQGELQGILVSLAALAAVITPPIATAMFYRFTADGQFYLPGAPYFLAAVVIALAIPLAWRAARP